MTTTATVLRGIKDAYLSRTATPPVPASGSTLRCPYWRPVWRLTTGTYILEASLPGEMQIIECVTGPITITNAAGATIASLLSVGETVRLDASAAGGWVASPLQTDLPNVKTTVSATTSTVTPGAGALSGARHVYWINTADGALALTTRTAAQLLSDVAGMLDGFTYLLTIVNRGDNTITITGGSGVSVPAENTVATLVTRTYAVTMLAGAATLVCVSKGTIET